MEGKSGVATYMAASTMTAVIMAGEKEKPEAAAFPCEWFICDEPSTYTWNFVIKVVISPLPWSVLGSHIGYRDFFFRFSEFKTKQIELGTADAVLFSPGFGVIHIVENETSFHADQI